MADSTPMDHADTGVPAPAANGTDIDMKEEPTPDNVRIPFPPHPLPPPLLKPSLPLLRKHSYSFIGP